ncbi:MAG: siderophore-iron reductase FhuF [Pseudomonadota bacterium]
MIPLLAPLFQGDWAPFGAGLSCLPPPAGAVRLDRLLAEPDRLGAILRLHATHLGTQDLRPASTAWLLDYCWMLLPAFTVSATMLQHRLPLRLDQTWLAIDADGHPERLHLADEGQPMPGTPAPERYCELLRHHLPPLIAALARHGRVAERLLWGNAARRVDAVFEQILLAAPLDPRCRADADVLLVQACWPDGHANPLQGPRRGIDKTVAGAQVHIALHRECCLCYMLPGQEYCTACPLDRANRRLLAASR